MSEQDRERQFEAGGEVGGVDLDEDTGIAGDTGGEQNRSIGSTASADADEDVRESGADGGA
jgi:hypothetical protein